MLEFETLAGRTCIFKINIFCISLLLSTVLYIPSIYKGNRTHGSYREPEMTSMTLNKDFIEPCVLLARVCREIV